MASELTEWLRRSQALRTRFDRDDAKAQLLTELQSWQIDRLRRTYEDLYEQVRYRAATAFFIDDLYGVKHYRARDRDLWRAHQVLQMTLPRHALHTLISAVELDVLSQELDLAMIDTLETRTPITLERYARAYRQVDDRKARERQIELLLYVGHELDELVKIPLIHTALRLAHGPAHVAGFGELQDFLERGFAAFEAMDGAKDFLDTIRARETKLMQRLLARAAD